MPTTGGALASTVPCRRTTRRCQEPPRRGRHIIAKDGDDRTWANWMAGSPLSMAHHYSRSAGTSQSVRPAARPARHDGRRPSRPLAQAVEFGHRAPRRVSGPPSRPPKTSGSILSPTNQNIARRHQAHRGPHQPLRDHPPSPRIRTPPARMARTSPTPSRCRRGSRAHSRIRMTPPPRLHAAAGGGLHEVPKRWMAWKGARIGIRGVFYAETKIPGRDVRRAASTERWPALMERRRLPPSRLRAP